MVECLKGDGIGIKKCLEKGCGKTWEIPITYDAIINDVNQRKQIKRDFSPKDVLFYNYDKRLTA
jgi:hypothetical protein